MAFWVECELLNIIFICIIGNYSFIGCYALKALFDFIILITINISYLLDFVAHAKRNLMLFLVTIAVINKDGITSSDREIIPSFRIRQGCAFFYVLRNKCVN